MGLDTVPTRKKNMKQLRVRTKATQITPYGNWNTAKNFFPEITVNQNSGTISVETFYSEGHQKKASVSLEWITVDTKKNASLVRGEVSVQNWKNYQCSGSQKFCYAIFEGDSSHIYVHRAPASKGWMNAKPQDIKRRLRKLGIGADKEVIQQGDFLLKPVKHDGDFKHETQGAGHHKFVAPVLYTDSDGKRYYKLNEPVVLVHHATDGIQHPDVVIPTGIYQVGTTTSSLSHNNFAD